MFGLFFENKKTKRGKCRKLAAHIHLKLQASIGLSPLEIQSGITIQEWPGLAG